MTRIAIGGFLHESHSFAPHPTTWQDFVHPAGFPPLTEGDAMLDAVRGTSVPAAGALAAAVAEGADVVPLAWTLANPAGPVQDEAFERIAALICAGLSRALDAALQVGAHRVLGTGAELVVLLIHHQVPDRHQLVDVVVGEVDVVRDA